ncbi:TadE/TadG family type IV pilus assembly protein [Blastomonas sp. CCH10-E1]|uniref:TadE/TadG family type IV pilus assembly protein n=1 Tax=Blastomonas sp. CCH10-E1 TaxID=1768737 RepID=UPI000825B872|nr:TadE/TadG family type IV pilus assembly protein [Blastomonas sp. CCH10-E1]
MMTTPIAAADARPGFIARTRSLARRLKRDRSGLALIEFAFSLPIFIGLGFYGVEVSNLAITQMKMSQIALNMADNASRIGTLNATLGAKVISEEQINDVFQAAAIQAGAAGIYQDGRTVLSSLELNADGGQTIMWQRCKGILFDDSDYGPEGVTSVNEV